MAVSSPICQPGSPPPGVTGGAGGGGEGPERERYL